VALKLGGERAVRAKTNCARFQLPSFFLPAASLIFGLKLNGSENSFEAFAKPCLENRKETYIFRGLQRRSAAARGVNPQNFSYRVSLRRSSKLPVLLVLAASAIMRVEGEG
jgi:hypothetical protein